MSSGSKILFREAGKPGLDIDTRMSMVLDQDLGGYSKSAYATAAYFDSAWESSRQEFLRLVSAVWPTETETE